jgi:uncharacterized RDD family membrane protein YckC
MSSKPGDLSPAPGAFGDKLTIDTPEQTALEFNIAGIGSRFLALALDSLVQVVVGLVLLVLFALATAAFGEKFPTRGLWFLAILILAWFVLYFGYFAIFEAIWNGQTPGKRMAQIRVIKESGRPITPGESVARNLMRIVDQLPGFYAVAIISALISRQNKRLGDFVAGTVVVHERMLRDFAPSWQPAKQADVFNYGTERLSPDEFALVEAFLNRRAGLETSVRRRMADQIVQQIKSKLLLPSEGLPSNENLLEAVAAQRRSMGRMP